MQTTGSNAQERVWEAQWWPVYRVRVLTRDDPLLSVVATGPELDQLRRAVGAVGGLFVLRDPASEPPIREWDLGDEEMGRAFATAARLVDVTDQASLAGFLSTWGHLGVGVFPPRYTGAFVDRLRPLLSSAALGRADSVEATATELRTWQAALRRMESLRPHDEAGWRRFAPVIQGKLLMIGPTIGWDRHTKRPVRRWGIDRPAQVLWLQLLALATGGGRLKRCDYCGAFFTSTDRRKVFCTVRCTNRASAARHYAEKKKALRAKQGAGASRARRART